MSERLSWTQPVCNDCWDEDHPDRPSPGLEAGDAESCCKCDYLTRSGIYVRIDPTSVPYPRVEATQ